MPVLVPHANLAKELGVDKVESDARTVRALLDEVAARLPDTQRAALFRAALLLNGRNIHYLKGQNTPLEPDDVLWMVLPSGGG